MKLRKFIECEITHDKMRERAECYINPEHVVYIEEDEEYKGYSYIGLVSGATTIVKGTLEEVRKHLRG
jgi:hypothetical protein